MLWGGWELKWEYRVPRIVFVNKMDPTGSSRESVANHGRWWREENRCGDAQKTS
jgi:hypothetical protein